MKIWSKIPGEGFRGTEEGNFLCNWDFVVF